MACLAECENPLGSAMLLYMRLGLTNPSEPAAGRILKMIQRFNTPELEESREITSQIPWVHWGGGTPNCLWKYTSAEVTPKGRE